VVLSPKLLHHLQVLEELLAPRGGAAGTPARARAIYELANAGVLEDFTGNSKDDITRELEKMSVSSSAESELAALKARRAGEQQ